jgi:PAS domain-containing protein
MSEGHKLLFVEDNPRDAELAPDTPFIFFSGSIGEESAVDALQAGATDYVLKDNMLRLAPAVRRALRDARAREKAAAALRTSIEARERAEQEYRVIFDHSVVGIYAVDAAGTVVSANAALARMRGGGGRGNRGAGQAARAAAL